jgi:hypothetical protein
MALSDMVVSIEDCVEKLRHINISILKGRLERGNILKHIKNTKAYVNYDSYVSNWNEFVEAIGINRETARQDMEVWEYFARQIMESKERLETCSYERLVRLLPVVKKEQQMAEELVDMATRSNRADFNNNVRELKGQIAHDTCDRHFERVIEYEKCLHCGEFRKKSYNE